MTAHDGRRARAVRTAAVAAVLCTLLPAMPAAADCLDWTDPTVQVVRGVIPAVPGAGDVSYRIAFSYIGFNHHLGAVEIRWTHDGRVLRQLLYHGAHDRPPATLVRTGQGLDVRVTYCETGADICRTDIATWIYDAARRGFRAAASADEHADADCGAAMAD
jgi:hypothetical protein